MNGRIARLGDLVTIAGGGTPRRGEASFWGAGIPWATVKDLDGLELSCTEESITADGLRNSASSLVAKGSIVIATRMALGKAVVNTVELAINQDLKALTCGPDIEPRYLLHYLVSQAPRIEAMGKGATVKGVTLDRLVELPVPLPPIAEQRRIAAILDGMEAIRRRRQESLTLIEAFLRSAFLELFGDPVRNGKGWDLRQLHELATVDRGRFTPRPRNSPEFYGGSFPFIQTGDIASSNGVLRVWRQTLNDRGAAVSRRFPRGTIATTIAANIGDTAIVEFDFYCPDSVVGIIPRESLVVPEYLETCLRFQKPVLEARAPMTAQRNINLGVLRPLMLPVPPLRLQVRFATLHKRALGLAGRAEEMARDGEALYGALAQQAFRGDL